MKCKRIKLIESIKNAFIREIQVNAFHFAEENVTGTESRVTHPYVNISCHSVSKQHKKIISNSLGSWLYRLYFRFNK